MIETICFVAGIILIVLFTPWFMHILSLFTGAPGVLLLFLNLALLIRFILFVIHRGADS